MTIDGIFITRKGISQFGFFLRTFKLKYCWEVRINKSVYTVELRFSILRLKYRLYINGFAVDSKICLLPLYVKFHFQLLGEPFLIEWVSSYGQGFVLQEMEALKSKKQFTSFPLLDFKQENYLSI